jgi:hypothetical protein
MDIWALNILKFASTVESLPDALQGNRIGELFLLDSVVSPGGMDAVPARGCLTPATTDAVKQKVHAISEVQRYVGWQSGLCNRIERRPAGDHGACKLRNLARSFGFWNDATFPPGGDA